MLVGLAGDHGLAPVFHLLNPEVEVFDALRAEGIDFHVEKEDTVYPMVPAGADLDQMIRRPKTEGGQS